MDPYSIILWLIILLGLPFVWVFPETLGAVRFQSQEPVGYIFITAFLGTIIAVMWPISVPLFVVYKFFAWIKIKLKL